MNCKVCETNDIDFTCDDCEFGMCFDCFDYYLTTENGQLLACSNCHRNIKSYKLIKYITDDKYDKTQFANNILRKYADYAEENRHSFEMALIDIYENNYKVEQTSAVKIIKGEIKKCTVSYEKDKVILNYKEPKKEELLFPCTNCNNGKITKSYICNSCNIELCEHCHENKHDNDCDKSAIESAKYIMSLMKCPKCTTRIEKAEGCVMMFCTKCFCKFDSKTGDILNGHLFHNDLAVEHQQDPPSLPIVENYYYHYNAEVNEIISSDMLDYCLDDITSTFDNIITSTTDSIDKFISEPGTILNAFNGLPSSVLFGVTLRFIFTLTLASRTINIFMGTKINNTFYHLNTMDDNKIFDTMLLIYYTKEHVDTTSLIIYTQGVYDIVKKLRRLKENVLNKTRQFIEDNINEDLLTQIIFLKLLLVECAKYVKDVSELFNTYTQLQDYYENTEQSSSVVSYVIKYLNKKYDIDPIPRQDLLKILQMALVINDED